MPVGIGKARFQFDRAGGRVNAVVGDAEFAGIQQDAGFLAHRFDQQGLGEAIGHVRQILEIAFRYGEGHGNRFYLVDHDDARSSWMWRRSCWSPPPCWACWRPSRRR